MKTLFVIPARGGSTGLPGKNIRQLNQLPLIIYSLGYARLFSEDADICVSTDAPEIAAVLEEYGYRVPFFRPAGLATDRAGTYEVLLHALQYFEEKRGAYDRLVLLQPTSPFRRRVFLEEALGLYHNDLDMVVSVQESKSNPYFNLFEEDGKGYLKLSKKVEGIERRQDAPAVYQYNGSLYVVNCRSLGKYSSMAQFDKIVKYIMPGEYSLDIDNALDWCVAEYLLNNSLIIADGKY